MNEFANNIQFLKFLNLAKNDENILSALKSNNLGVLKEYPGLNDNEKKLLTSFDWKKIDIQISDNDLINFDPSVSPFAAGSVCESKVATEAVETKCYKL